MITKNLCIFADGNPLFLPLEKDGLCGGLKVASLQEALQA
jgi:hypothetical protein